MMHTAIVRIAHISCFFSLAMIASLSCGLGMAFFGSSLCWSSISLVIVAMSLDFMKVYVLNKQKCYQIVENACSYLLYKNREG